MFKNGQSGLTVLLSVITFLFVIGLLIFIIVLAFSGIKDTLVVIPFMAKGKPLGLFNVVKTTWRGE